MGGKPSASTLYSNLNQCNAKHEQFLMRRDILVPYRTLLSAYSFGIGKKKEVRARLDLGRNCHHKPQNTASLAGGSVIISHLWGLILATISSININFGEDYKITT